jgi:hypothetical protein
MNNDSRSTQSGSEEGFVRNSGKVVVEDAYSVNAYACMYYMMTPSGCNQTKRTNSKRV